MRRNFRKYNNYVGGTVPLGWHTPTYSEMFYLLNSRVNSIFLRTFGRIDIDGNGNFIDGCFLLPDDWVLPAGISMTITTADFLTNTYSLVDLSLIEDNGGVFLPVAFNRSGNVLTPSTAQLDGSYMLGTQSSYGVGYCYFLKIYPNRFFADAVYYQKYRGCAVRLCINDNDSEHIFSVSATQKIRFARSNIKYHCKQKIWSFHEHSYDIIGADNVNIKENYDGWIDLFGYGTSGVNFSPTLHTTNNNDYANGDLLGTVNDWGVNF